MILRLFISLVLIGQTIAQDDLIAQTSFGSIQGYESTSTDGTRVRIFKSVPFASPPIGELRWKLPVEPKKWEGVKDGTKYSAACMSNSTTSKSPQPWVDEDCLYVNVFVHGECSAQKKCPVIVYYHGGGMNFDSATYFNDTALKDTFAANGVMLVIPAFRLGFTGQFSLGDNQELVPSNLGVHDALHALKYVKKEAAAFGGDTDAITVMGHSFGGGLAIMLAFSPLRKLQVPIHQFIIMSPGFFFDSPETNEKLSREMVKRAGCSNISKRLALSCMTKKTGPELLAIQRKLEEESFPRAGATFGGVLLRPPLFPFNSVPELMDNPPHTNILIGSTLREMDHAPVTGYGVKTGALIGAKNVEELDELYYKLIEAGKTNQTHTAHTQSLYVSVYLVSRAVMENGFKAFLYTFDQPTHNLHTDDLSYLMGIHEFEKDENEKEIAKFYPQLFLNFTKYGEPSPNWKPTDRNERHFSIEVNLTSGRMPEMRDTYQKETIDFWVRKAPKIDKMITVTKASGVKMQLDKVTGEFRDLNIEDDSTTAKNETLIPVLLVHRSYFPSLLLICAVFLLGIVLGRYLLADSNSQEERTWILGPNERGMRIDPRKSPPAMIVRLIAALSLVGFLAAKDDLIVKTSYGAIQGYESASSDGSRIRVFKSVPFASPPVGNLRWKLPVEPKKWEGVKDGTKYSAACMSNSTTSNSPQPWVDEDCLYINIFIHGECSTTKKCPIIVYYHGGAMNYDSATYFNDSALIETYASNGVMLVIPAFRLGFTGQFSLGDNQELVPSNLGVYDALRALKFLNKEAAAFGGDPDAITVMGHSFGGVLSILLAFSPVRKLEVPINQFIMMSPGFYMDPPEINERISKEMVKRAGCSSISKKLAYSCMMKKPGHELLAIQREMEEENFGSAPFGGVIMRPPLFPFKAIPDLLKNPPKANIMIGSTTKELDFPPTPDTPHGSKVGALVGAKNLVELDELYYNLTQSGKTNQTHSPDTQGLFLSVYLTSRAVMEKGNRVFLYSFDQPTHNMHTDDLSYLMGIHGFEKDENEKEIAKFYPQLFLNFSKFGEPSPNWKPMNLKDRYYSIEVNLTSGRMPEMHDHYEKETIDFWIRKAPKIDKMITVTRAAGSKMQWDKITGEFRDLVLEEDSSPAKNETLIPVVLVHASYVPSIFLVFTVFFLGIILGRYLLSDSNSQEERMWILGPDGRGIRIDAGKAPDYAEQIMIIRLFIAVSLLVIPSLTLDGLTVKTSYGSILGYESTSSDGTRVRIFKSVPFASPPVGNLRWKVPVEPKKWEGVKDGTNYSAACMSNSTTSSSPQLWVDEDCLYLNIFMHGECSAKTKCPIVVYFHGGDMNYDSATYFNDTALIETYAANGVMLVIPAFRLGFTGQFSLGDNQELIPSNLGVYDALHAIKYLHKEAAAFGGDKESITLMGHSFGGALAFMLGSSPVRKLQVPIDKLILMSAGLTFESPEIIETLSKEMVKRAGCSNISKKIAYSCMMKKTGPELLAIQRKMEEERFGGALFGGVIMLPPLLPFKSIPDMLQNSPKADILIGGTLTEMDVPFDPLLPHGAKVGKLIGAKNVVELDELYYNLTLSGKTNQIHSPDSQNVYVGVYVTAKAVMKNGNKAYLYSFDQPTHNVHTDDLSYLMGIHVFEKDENEKEIAKFYPQLFLNFTKCGVPSPNWKAMNLKDRYYSIEVNLTSGRMPEMRDHYEKETIDFWVRKAPKIDRMITVTRAAGAKMQWDKVTGEFRDLVLEDDSTPPKNETLIPLVLVHTSYFPSFLLIGAVFLFGLALGRCLLTDSNSQEERMWILGPDGRRMSIDPRKAPPAYAEQLF